MKTYLALLLLLFLGLTGGPGAFAQDGPDADDNESVGLRPFWQAQMKGGHYMVSLNSIAQIGKHEYVSDGVARVVEVTIATSSSVVVRFYYLEPATTGGPAGGATTAIDRMTRLVESGAKRAGTDVDAVVKNYPTTTHAHTIEFRVQEEDHLDSLYRSLLRSLTYGKGRNWSEPGETE